jgi:hypothetical protein
MVGINPNSLEELSSPLTITFQEFETVRVVVNTKPAPQPERAGPGRSAAGRGTRRRDRPASKRRPKRGDIAGSSSQWERDHAGGPV